MYKRLDPHRIIATLEVLERRIAERFPGAGLTRVCGELLEAARESRSRIEQLEAPNYLLRTISFAATGVGILLLAYIGTIIEVKRDAENLYGVLQGFDSAFNIVVLMGAGAIFLSTLEARWKRQQAMAHLHELRSIIHVIDMHQLTKDPSRVSTVGVATRHSPQRPLSAFELSRYLDYCSEMLSLSAKVAALYAQGTKDQIVIDAASDLGQITANMSGKIWQKITMVQSQIEADLPAQTMPLPGTNTTTQMTATKALAEARPDEYTSTAPPEA
ncbi:MAG: hypothetical protein KDJ37_15550 [Hyphomicrobiaceae bacterium]|nr:hypothetical protein [Hyphomicrobiaceae bacterium]